MLFYHL